MLVFSSLILITAFILIAWEKIPKVTTALIGSALMLVMEKGPQEKIFSHIDFSVIFLLVSMMIIVTITARTGVFKKIAFEMIKLTKGNPKLILLSVALFTAFFSAFLDNVTTVFLILPVIFSIASELDIDPIPYLITIILSSNIGGTATLIGDPPNIIIGSAAGLSFLDFVRELTLIVVLIFVVSMFLLLFLFRRELKCTPAIEDKLQNVDNKNLIKDKKSMIRSVVVLALVILGFLTHDITKIDAYIISMLGAGVLLLFDTPSQIIQEVEWTTIFFFIGLFLIVGGFAEAGGIKLLSEKMLSLTGGSSEIAAYMILWMSGIFSAVIDNIPYTATMVPLIKELSATMNVYPLWWSLALGACLGGNATIIGAAANVIVIDSSRAFGYNISFMKFFKYGVLVTAVSLIMSSAYLYFRFFISM